ncbi:cysteine-rich receptor-like protein kinase [Tanacetum coccineum]
MKWEVEAERRDLNDIEVKQWKESRKNWLNKDRIRARMWKQKARIKWAVEGDANSKYFHSVIRKRRSNNMIRGLSVDGIWVEDREGIKQGMAEHYHTLFMESNTERPNVISDSFLSISEEEAMELENRFSEEEVWGAIKSCGSSKAPGPNGFNFKFIKRYWEILKGDLMAAIDWFWENGEISRGCNASFISLIPKTSDPLSPKDYRPISLIGCYYKIVTKLLAERIKKVIGKVIGKVQNVFIKGRYILDGVLVANETIDYLRSHRKQGLVFKVDFEKAYDSVCWNFIQSVMRQMGFSSKWCKWVDVCLRTTSVSVLVNGSPSNEFNMARGSDKVTL